MNIIPKEELENLPSKAQEAYIQQILGMKSKEIDKLPIEEQKQYYEEYRRLVLERKLTNTSLGASTIAPKLIGPTIKIAKKVIPLFTDKKCIHECEGTENIPEEPVIFTDTHQGLLDNFISIPETSRHAVILHGREVNPILLACQLNTGWVGVIKGNKTNNNNAKLDMIKLLLKGISIRYFPEGTWNLSPNKLHLPMSWGIIDTAKKAGVPIIPVAHEYVYEEKNGKLVITKIYSKYGTPIYVPFEADLSDKLEELSAQFATMKFELMYKATLNSNESKKVIIKDELGNEKVDAYFERDNISDIWYVNWLKEQYQNLEFGGLNWSKELEYIFGANQEKYAFTWINEPDFNENNELLPHPEIYSSCSPKYKRVLKPGEAKHSKIKKSI